MWIVTELLTSLQEFSKLLFLYILTPDYTMLCFPVFLLFNTSVPQLPRIVLGIPLPFSLTYTIHVDFADNKQQLPGSRAQLQILQQIMF